MKYYEKSDIRPKAIAYFIMNHSIYRADISGIFKIFTAVPQNPDVPFKVCLNRILCFSKDDNIPEGMTKSFNRI